MCEGSLRNLKALDMLKRRSTAFSLDDGVSNAADGSLTENMDDDGTILLPDRLDNDDATTAEQNEVGRIRPDLTPHDKISFLEEVRAQLYSTVGHIQHHLDGLQGVQSALIIAASDSSGDETDITLDGNRFPSSFGHTTMDDHSQHQNGGGPLGLIGLVMGNTVNGGREQANQRHDKNAVDRALRVSRALAQRTAWLGLQDWVRRGGQLARQSLSALSLRSSSSMRDVGDAIVRSDALGIQAGLGYDDELVRDIAELYNRRATGAADKRGLSLETTRKDRTTGTSAKKDHLVDSVSVSPTESAADGSLSDGHTEVGHVVANSSKHDSDSSNKSTADNAIRSNGLSWIERLSEWLLGSFSIVRDGEKELTISGLANESTIHVVSSSGLGSVGTHNTADSSSLSPSTNNHTTNSIEISGGGKGAFGSGKHHTIEYANMCARTIESLVSTLTRVGGGLPGGQGDETILGTNSENSRGGNDTLVPQKFRSSNYFFRLKSAVTWNLPRPVRSASSTQMGDFLIDGDVKEVVERLFLRRDALAMAIEACGDDVIDVGPWRKLEAADIKVLFSFDSTNAVSSDEYQQFYQRVGVDMPTAALRASLKNIWVRDLTFLHHSAGFIFGNRSTILRTIQALNIHEHFSVDGISSTGNLGNVGGMKDGSLYKVTLVTYNNISHFGFGLGGRGGSSVFTRWDLTAAGPDDRTKRSDGRKTGSSSSQRSTKVVVSMHTDCPSSALWQSLIQSRVAADIKNMVSQWYRLAVLPSTSTNSPVGSAISTASSSSAGVSSSHESKNNTSLKLAPRSLLKDESDMLRLLSRFPTETDSDGDGERDKDKMRLTAIDLLTDTVNATLDSLPGSSPSSSSSSSSSEKSSAVPSLSVTTIPKSPSSSNIRKKLFSLFGGEFELGSLWTRRAPSQSSDDPRFPQSLLGEVEQKRLDSHLRLIGDVATLRANWRESAFVLRAVASAPAAFEAGMEHARVRRRVRRSGIFRVLRLGVAIKLFFWGGLVFAAMEASRRSDDIAAGADFVAENVKDFVSRRIVIPTYSIVNDVVFNRRVSLTDREALKDAKRSLSVMLNDFVKEYRSKLTEQEKKSIVNALDMTPISLEYEKELKRPIPSLVSGRIARLVLIQLQFVKKELLVAMQAIDELFNANQVNLQLLAVTPAVLALLVLQMAVRGALSTLRSTSRGRMAQSSHTVHRELRDAVRELEKFLFMSQRFDAPDSHTLSSPSSPSSSSVTTSTTAGAAAGGDSERDSRQSQQQQRHKRNKEKHELQQWALSVSPPPITQHDHPHRPFLSSTPASSSSSLTRSSNNAAETLELRELGRLMSILFRLQSLLVYHSTHFDEAALLQLQEDLRDIASPGLSTRQRVALVERIGRTYTFLQIPSRKLWAIN